MPRHNRIVQDKAAASTQHFQDQDTPGYTDMYARIVPFSSILSRLEFMAAGEGGSWSLGHMSLRNPSTLSFYLYFLTHIFLSHKRTLSDCGVHEGAAVELYRYLNNSAY